MAHMERGVQRKFRQCLVGDPAASTEGPTSSKELLQDIKDTQGVGN